MKHISSNFKQGIKIAMLMALTISMAMTTGCKMPNGTTGGNENPGNSGNGGNSGSTDNEQDQDSKYGVPYDKAIGNGNYILHNFISDNDNINKKETVIEDMNHYLALGETCVKGKANELGTATSGRTTYFDSFVNAIQNDNNFALDDINYSYNNLDRAADTISEAAEPILVDIIKNIDSQDDREAFYGAYCILANEAYKEGLGNARQYSGSAMSVYEEAKEINDRFGSFNPRLQKIGSAEGQVYDNNFFAQLTDLTDELLANAASNMGQNIEVTDLQKVVNLALTPHSLFAMDNLTRTLLGHNTCLMGLSEVNTMYNALLGKYKTVQAQNMEQGMSL